MRHGTPNNRRSRNNRGPHGGSNHNNANGGNRRGVQNRNQIFDSNGPDVRIRGTAHQVCEKYMALAKDAQSVGDIVLCESYLQHAEHYQRMINSWNEEFKDYSRPEGEAYTQAPATSNEDDLSLPVSILGGDPKAEKAQDSAEVFKNDTVLEDA